MKRQKEEEGDTFIFAVASTDGFVLACLDPNKMFCFHLLYTKAHNLDHCLYRITDSWYKDHIFVY